MDKISRELAFEQRLTDFSIVVIKFCQSLEQTTIIKPIINQLIKSSTSMGANYVEANNASSSRDFQAKIYISKKEAQETKYWLKILMSIEEDRNLEIEPIWQEAYEIHLIFQKIISTLKANDKIKKLKN